MVKIKESSREEIKPDRYYFWTWRPDTTNKYITEKKLYRKHLTSIPYFTRSHIKRTQMHRVFHSKGKQEFDKRYARKLYGQRQGISAQAIKRKRIQVRNSILQNLQ